MSQLLKILMLISYFTAGCGAEFYKAEYFIEVNNETAEEIFLTIQPICQPGSKGDCWDKQIAIPPNSANEYSFYHERSTRSQCAFGYTGPLKSKTHRERTISNFNHKIVESSLSKGIICGKKQLDYLGRKTSEGIYRVKNAGLCPEGFDPVDILAKAP